MEETTIHNYTSKYSLKHGTSNHISSELNLVSGRAFFSTLTLNRKYIMAKYCTAAGSAVT